MTAPLPRHVHFNGVGTARLAQSVERKALNLAVVGSSPTVGVLRSKDRWRGICRDRSCPRQKKHFDLHLRRCESLFASLPCRCSESASKEKPKHASRSAAAELVSIFDPHPRGLGSIPGGRP